MSEIQHMNVPAAELHPSGTTLTTSRTYVTDGALETSRSGVPFLRHVDARSSEYRLNVGWTIPVTSSVVSGYRPSYRS